MQDHRPAHPDRLTVLLHQEPDLLQFGVGPFRGADQLQHLVILLARPLATSQRGDSGTRSIPKNGPNADSTATSSITRQIPLMPHPVVVDDRIDDESQELAEDDPELIARDHPAPRLGGHDLGQEDGTTADAPPTASPRMNRKTASTTQLGGKNTAEGSHHEDQGQGLDAALPAETSGDAPLAHTADRSPEYQD